MKYGDKVALLYAPEPKLQCFGLGKGKGTVLAEDFFAPQFRCMDMYYGKGNAQNIEKAHESEMWKFNISSIFGQFGGGVAERCVYLKTAGVDLGPPRPPQMPLKGGCQPVLDALEDANFFTDLTQQNAEC